MRTNPTSLTDLLGRNRDNVLLRVVSGSQAYGLATPASDTDERGVYALPNKAYACLLEPVEHIQDERGDIAYDALRKFLALASAANPSALEMLFAPEDCVIYCTPEAEELIEARSLFVTRRCVESHIGYARGQIQRARGQNKWINNPQPAEAPSREAFCHLILGPWPGTLDVNGIPLRPTPLADTGLDLREYHCAALERVPQTYRLYHYGAAARGVFRNGQLVCESIPREHEQSHLVGLLVYDEHAWERASRDHTNYWEWRNHRNEARWRTQESGEIDYDAKNLMHTFRLLASAEAILREGRPRVRFDGEERDQLLRIRAGAFSYGELVAQAETKIASLQVLADSCTLPIEPGAEIVDDLLNAVTESWASRVGRARVPLATTSSGNVMTPAVSSNPVNEPRGGIGPIQRATIVSTLAAVAAECDICILHACESGSRGWGFASSDSDYDVRFLFVHERDWYLRVRPGRDTITRMLPGDLDLVGWDLRKALGLFAASNASFFEHIGSDIVYRDEAGLLERLRSLIPEFFNPIAAANHYLGLARKMRDSYLGAERVNAKKLFYVLRPLAALQWIEQRTSMPPTCFDDVLNGIDLTTMERAWIDELKAQKTAVRESDHVLLDPQIRSWIDHRIAHFTEPANSMPHRRAETKALDRLLVEFVPD